MVRIKDDRIYIVLNAIVQGASKKCDEELPGINILYAILSNIYNP